MNNIRDISGLTSFFPRTHYYLGDGGGAKAKTNAIVRPGAGRALDLRLVPILLLRLIPMAYVEADSYEYVDEYAGRKAAAQFNLIGILLLIQNLKRRN